MADGKKWLRGFLTESDIQKISDAVQKAERGTSGEIVPMIVHRSSVIGHLPWQLTILFALLALSLEWFSSFMPWWIPILTLLACAVLGFTLARLSFIQRLFLPKADQTFQVEERALLEFYLAGLEKTAGRTGILIFISLTEHQTVVLADKGIAAKLPAETWNGLVQTILNGIKSGQTAQGLIQAIETCGQLLAQHFPPLTDDKNELANHLIIKE